MITPATIADWTMFGGLVTLLGGVAAASHSRLFNEGERRIPQSTMVEFPRSGRYDERDQQLRKGA
jgi:hypothetical protein